MYSQWSMTTDITGTDVINNLYLYYNFYFVQHERTVTAENVKKIIPDYRISGDNKTKLKQRLLTFHFNMFIELFPQAWDTRT